MKMGLPELGQGIQIFLLILDSRFRGNDNFLALSILPSHNHPSLTLGSTRA